MRSLYAVYRKEMSHYFVSPIAYVVIGLFLFISGYFFSVFVGQAIEWAARQGLEEMQYGGGAQAIDVPGSVIRGYFGLLGTLFLFIVPMLTMGVYAEERKRGTMELLMTSPITDLQIVLGKFLASISLIAHHAGAERRVSNFHAGQNGALAALASAAGRLHRLAAAGIFGAGDWIVPVVGHREPIDRRGAHLLRGSHALGDRSGQQRQRWPWSGRPVSFGDTPL